jgi:hypothetical protein
VLGAVPAPSLSADNADGIIALVTGPVFGPAGTRKVRVVVLTPNGVRAKLPDGSPMPDVVLTETTTGVTLDDSAAAILKKVFMATQRAAVLLELILPGQPSADPNASARAKSAFEAFAKINVVASDTKTQLRVAGNTDQPVFAEQGVTVDEIISLRMAG